MFDEGKSSTMYRKYFEVVGECKREEDWDGRKFVIVLYRGSFRYGPVNDGALRSELGYASAGALKRSFPFQTSE